MEDLMVLAEIFGLKVIGEDEDILSSNGGIPTITVEGEKGRPVFIRNLRGSFHATGEISGVPMRFFGNGSWRFGIDI